jgi:hypothetical protein
VAKITKERKLVMKKKIKQASEKHTVKGSIEAHGGFVEDGKTLEKRGIDYISKHAYDGRRGFRSRMC